MRIPGVILTIFFITWQQTRSHTHEEHSENLKSATVDGNNCRFEHLVFNGISNAALVSDQKALLFRTSFIAMPNECLTNVSIETWITLYNNYFSEDVGFVSKIMDTLENEKRREDFLNSISTGLRLPFTANYCGNRTTWPTVLQVMAEDLIETSATEENALWLLLQNRLLLFSAPPNFLLKLGNVHKLFLLAYATAAGATDKTDAFVFWKHQSSLTRRSWSKILLQPSGHVASFIKEWKNSNFFQVLNTIDTVELQNLIRELLVNPTAGPEFFCSIDWNAVQIRKIIDTYFQNSTNVLATDNCNKFLSRLLPDQIARAVEQADVSLVTHHLQNVDQVSLPQALQLSEFFAMSSQLSTKTLPKIVESNCVAIGKLLHSQTNSFLSQFYEQTLKMKIIKCLDSKEYSILQAHYILGRKGLRDVKDNLLNLKGLIAAIPASYYFDLVKASQHDGSLENHFIHVLKYFPSHANKIAALAAFHACKLIIDASRCIESVLENDDNGVISAMISPLDVRRNVDEIWSWLATKAENDNEFKQHVAHLPSFVLTELLLKKDLVISYEQLFNEAYPIHLAIMGLNCEILSQIEITNFLPIFEFYNRQRKLYQKEFPKDLQKCAQTAFLSYLRMKSNSTRSPHKTDLLQYLDLADIRSIGGYVMSTLPANSIAKSKHRHNIVEQIGRLSLPELMLATTRTQLFSIALQYLNKRTNIRTEHLITLGNLTHFMHDDYVRQMDASALKFALEAELIDTRICASSTTRKVWADKLIEAFGSPETWDESTLLKIGDMLIVINQTSFDALNETSGSRAADLFRSKYKHLVDWIPRRLSFYEVCRLILPQTEHAEYEISVTRLALFYAASIERLLSTVTVIETATIASDHHNLDTEQTSVWQTNDDVVHLDDMNGRSALETTEKDNLAMPDDRLTSSPTPTVTYTSTSQPTDPPVNDYAAADSNQVTEIGTTETRTDGTTSTVSSTIDHSTIRQSSDLFADPKPVTSTFTIPMWPSTGTTNHSSIETNWQTTSSDIGIRSNNDNDKDEAPSSSASPPPTNSTTVTTTATSNSTSTSTSVVMISDSVWVQNVSKSTTPLPEVTYTDVSTLSTRREREPALAVTLSSFYSSSSATTVDQKTLASSSNSTTPVSHVQTTTDDGYRANHDLSAPETSPTTVFQTNVNLKVVNQQQSLEIDPETLQEVVQHLLSNASFSNMAEVQFGRRRKRGSGDANIITSRRRLSVSCNTLKILGTMSEFVLNSTEVEINEEKDSFECVELLAQVDNLNTERRKNIWSLVSSHLSNANLTFVAGKLLSAADEEELIKVTNTYDVRTAGALELIGSLSDASHLFSDKMRQDLAGKILSDNQGIAELKQFPVFMRALGKLLCSVRSSDLVIMLEQGDFMSRTDMYHWWSATHAFNDCPLKCLLRIANATYVRQCEKPSSQCNASVVDALGPIAAAAVWNAYKNPRSQLSNGVQYLSTPAIVCLLNWTSSKLQYLQLQHLLEEYSNRSTNLGLSLSSTMLLTDNDCRRVSINDGCPFTSSLASVILAKDSLQLPTLATGSSPSTTSSSTSRANISCLFVLSASLHSSWYLIAMYMLLSNFFHSLI